MHPLVARCLALVDNGLEVVRVVERMEMHEGECGAAVVALNVQLSCIRTLHLLHSGMSIFPCLCHSLVGQKELFAQMPGCRYILGGYQLSKVAGRLHCLDADGRTRVTL